MGPLDETMTLTLKVGSHGRIQITKNEQALKLNSINHSFGPSLQAQSGGLRFISGDKEVHKMKLGLSLTENTTAWCCQKHTLIPPVHGTSYFMLNCSPIVEAFSWHWLLLRLPRVRLPNKNSVTHNICREEKQPNCDRRNSFG